MTAPDAQQITNRAVLSGRKVASRMRIILVPVLLAFVLDVVPWHASETLRRVIVALISASGLAILCFAWRYRTMASRSDVASYVGLAANSPQLLGRRSRIALSGRETAARYGATAAQHIRRSSAAVHRFVRVVYAFLLVITLLVNFLGYNWPSALALFAVALAIVVSGNALTKSARQAGSRAIGSIADATGVTDVTVPTLPWTPEEYAAWCQAHGFQAYPSGRPEVGQTGQEHDPAGS